MSRRLSFALILLFSCASFGVLAAGPYTKIAEIPIGGAGGFDYNTPDPANHRLYVSHGNEVVVIDTDKNTVVGKISGLAGVHGIAVAETL